MNILTIDSAEEQKTLLSFSTSKKGLFQNDTCIFVGGIAPVHDKNPAKSSWFWFESGVKTSFPIKWNNGEPNNSGGQENCMSAFLSSTTKTIMFNDLPCSVTYCQFICQSVQNIPKA